MIIDFQFRAKTTDFRELLTSSIPECLLVTTRRFQPMFFFLILSVFRARVWSGPIDAPPDKDDGEFSSFYRDQVYSLKIVEVFKGEKEISHLPGVVSVGVRSPSLMVDLHTPTKFSSCSFRLYKGTEYLLSGYVVNNKLRSSFCSLRQEWTYVTPQQRAGLSGQYDKSC